MSNETKAAELMAEAERKLKSSQGFLGGLFGWVRNCSNVYHGFLIVTYSSLVYIKFSLRTCLWLTEGVIMYTVRLSCFVPHRYLYFMYIF